MAIQKLLAVMHSLRGPNGCPWDKEQNHQSIAKYLIEECYECVEAIEARDDKALKEELGDVLLQVVFHAQMAQERGAFDFEQVAQVITEKMISRHPHVFNQAGLSAEVEQKNGLVQVENSQDVLKNWNQIKKKEGKKSLMDGIPKALPELVKSARLQGRAQEVGFAWPQAASIIEKLTEEIVELKNELAKVETVTETNKDEVLDRCHDELGDVLLNIVNWSQRMGLDADKALRMANKKFEQRFRLIEEKVKKTDKGWHDFSLPELETFWLEAKKDLASAPSQGY